MRRFVHGFVAALGLGVLIAAAPGGHEAFLYWSNGTKWVQVSTSDPLPVTVASGSGDATAANQVLQLNQETTTAANTGTITTNTGTTATGIGAPADAAWTSGSGSLIAIAKGIYGKLAAALAVTQSGTWNITNVSGTVSLPTGAATATNQTAVTGSKAPGTAAASSQLAGGVYNSTPPTLTDGQQASDQLDVNGNKKVNCTNCSSTISILASATGGATGGTILSAASNNSTSIKASAGTLYSVTWLQTTTTLMSIRFYDTASAPTCSSATGMKLNFVAQSNAVAPGATISLGPAGIEFTGGIGACITGANANNDNTNAVTGLNLIYAYK